MRNTIIALLGALLLTTTVLGFPGPAAAAPAPQVSADGFGIALGEPSAARAIDLYVDPSCPHSGTLLARDGAQLRELIDAGALFVTLRPMNFLDRDGRDYSSRVDNALFLAAADPASTPAALLGFLQTLYERLPQTRAQLDDLQLAGVAGEAGLPPGVVVAVATRQVGVNPAAMGAANQAALHAVSPDGVGVPTVYDPISGRVIDTEAGWLDALIG